MCNCRCKRSPFPRSWRSGSRALTCPRPSAACPCQLSSNVHVRAQVRVAAPLGASGALSRRGVADHHSDPRCSAQAVIGQAATKAPIRSVCGKENAPLPYPFGGRASGVRRSLNPRLLRGDRGPFSFAGDDDVKARTFKHPPKLLRHAKTPQGLYSTREKLNVPEVRGQGQGRPLSACTCCCTCICSCTEERGKSVACASHYLNFAEAHTHRCSLDPPATCSSR